MVRIELSRPIAQPEFPLKDLAPENMQHVSIRLGDPELTSQPHSVTSEDFELHRKSHPHIEQYTQTGQSDVSPVEVVSHGMLLLEVMATAVASRHQPQVFDGATAKHALAGLGLGRVYLGQEARRSVAEFRQTLPNTTEIITEETEKRLGHALTEYAILGAALERRVLVHSVGSALKL